MTLSIADATLILPAGRYWLSTWDAAMTQRWIDMALDSAMQQNLNPAWLAADGGLLANLRVWENIAFPAGFVSDWPLALLESRLVPLLRLLKIDESEWKRWLGRPAVQLEQRERRLLGMLRVALQRPALLVAEAGFFTEESLPSPSLDLCNAALADGVVLAIGPVAPPPGWQFAEIGLERKEVQT
ncbi:hypothetical protein [Parachitinimonas caeni]|uniref:Uncharacterized protein n=1 Tax=Parachitinimonas caeni TaxID=3031301 RepID=A0ABT7DX20_9NEIS|nr:hypothetical protein [Parachitinimonas caeni]MDK2124612.1 hypothetical protein [Parachitinimonas caeni]